VLGLDGLSVGDCVGGAGAGPDGTDDCCACACSIRAQPPNTATHPVIKSNANALRANLILGIAVSFEPVFRCPKFDHNVQRSEAKIVTSNNQRQRGRMLRLGYFGGDGTPVQRREGANSA